MEQSKARILGLANGSCEPETGLEKHFVLVCQGKAKPASGIERKWVEIVSAAAQVDSRDGATSNRNEYRSSDDSAARISALIEEKKKLVKDLATETARAETFQNQVERRNLSLQSLSDSVEQLNRSLSESEKVVKVTSKELVEVNSKLSEASEKLSELQAIHAEAVSRIATLENLKQDDLQKLLPQKIAEIQDENKKVLELNKRFSDQNGILVEELRKFIPARVKCQVCDGEGRWVDKGTVRIGADYDGPNAVDVCSNCHGAGFLANPKREELGIAPLVRK